jgi:hypothetical protein
LILGKEKLTLILAKQYNHVLRVHATLATDHFFGSLAFLDGRHVHASAHCHWIFLSPFSWRYSLIVYYCYWFDSAEDISQKLGFHADHVRLVAGAFLSCWSLTLTWTQFVLWLSSGFVDMGGGERTLILHMNTVFPCCYEYESEDGCFADAAMCRCRVPLSG